MNNNLNYEPYLFISSKKFTISVVADLNKEIYYAEMPNEINTNQINFERLDYFLSDNIFKIEKKLKNFIKKISIILDLDIFFPIEISVKKNNYDSLVNLKNLHHLLYEIKDDCKKTIDDKKLIHMTIVNYKIDNIDYPFLPEDLKCNNFSLDVRLLCISRHLIQNFEKAFKKYHVSLNQVFDANYIESFFSNNENDIFLMTEKIKNGHNPNEVKIVDKSIKNRGFFEKFFNFFS